MLRTVQEHLVAGLRLDPDDVPGLSRLVVLGERRAPGALLRHCEPSTLGRLAAAALASEAAFGLLTGYAGWDGLDPEPAVAAWERAEQGQNWHDARLNPGVTWNHALGAGGGFSDGAAWPAELLSNPEPRRPLPGRGGSLGVPPRRPRRRLTAMADNRAGRAWMSS